jgi:organic radical activating enzyme
MNQIYQTTYPVMEHFYTIQGEGKNTGESAYFIRLGGCDVGCVWCDVKESWDAAIHPQLTVSFLMQAITQTPGKLVVITGGEPGMYDLQPLVAGLHELGKEVAIETSGTSVFHGNVDWYTFSPKKFKEPVSEAYLRANELKIVLFHRSDFEWAEKHANAVSSDCLLYLQPEWSKQEQLLPLIIDYVKNNPKWKISLQTHKYLQIP